jgi:hypothetical protein
MGRLSCWTTRAFRSFRNPPYGHTVWHTVKSRYPLDSLASVAACSPAYPETGRWNAMRGRAKSKARRRVIGGVVAHIRGETAHGHAETWQNRGDEVE